MKLQKKTLLSLSVLGAAAFLSSGLIALRPQPKPRAVEATLPLVEVVIAWPRAERMRIRAQGSLEPRDEIELVAEVAGRVVWISPAFDGAGEFAARQPLVRIARDDYEIAARRARAALERAESQLRLARATLARSQLLFDAGAASPAAHEQAAGSEQVSAANVADARAALAQAELALARTELRAPFAGRVRDRKVAFGQHLTPGTPVARVYRRGEAEVKLSLRAEDAAFVELPGSASAPGPLVALRASVGGATSELSGHIVGSAGALDPRTRLLTVTVRVAAAEAERAGLSLGAFVEAEIEGRELADVVRLPRSALSDESTVVVVDAQDALAVRAVELLRADDEHAWVSRGLAAGERVCAHAPSALAPGSRVRTRLLGAGTQAAETLGVGAAQP